MLVYNKFVNEFAPDLKALQSDPVFGAPKDLSKVEQEIKKRNG
jgi:hypothetical protein